MAGVSSFPWWQIKLRTVSHELTWFLGRRLPSTFPFVFVLGYAKSGTTWACQLLGDVLQLPFPRYSLLPVGFPAVVHGHEFVDARYPRGVYVVRDGRDVLVSLYWFSMRNVGEGEHPTLPRRLRRIYGSIRSKSAINENLPKLVEFMGRRRRTGNWGAHVRSFFDSSGHRFVLLRYEDLLHDGESALAGVVGKLTGGAPDADVVRMAFEKFSFTRQRERAPQSGAGADSAKLLRKGQAGDWRTHFTPDVARQFDGYFGEALVLAGYENDRSWVEKVNCERTKEIAQPAVS
jgi:hypothetical protein